VGPNFGLTVGVVFGLVGGISVMELAAPEPFGLGIMGSHEALAKGWSGFLLAHVIAIPIAAIAGLGFGLLLNRVPGQEMVVGIFAGFSAVGAFCMVWIMAPLTSPEVVWAFKGSEARNTLVLNDYFRWILDSTGEFQAGTYAPGDIGADGNPLPYRRPEGFFFPTGLVAYWLGMCAIMALFLRTRLGTAMTVSGSNPNYARSIGIHVPTMRVLSVVLSTVLAAIGILVYSQSYGFFQLYMAPLWMPFQAVAALLLGGASIRKASIMHAIIGVFLFQSLLTTSLPVVNDLIEGSDYAKTLENLPEIARIMIQNGIILYALAQVTKGKR
jgi:simple sugar transport system permease protein